MNPRAPDFPGFTAPTTDFGAVIDGRRSPPLIYEIDLSTARSYAASTASQIRLTGNSFFIDQAPDVGNAYCVFEGVQDDTGPLIRPAIFVQPGFVSRVPFANLWIANSAQAGKKLRIIYGTDIDFLPSLNGQISITGGVNAVPYGFTYAAAYKSSTNMAANTAETVFSAAANTNGALLHRANVVSLNATNNRSAVIAHTIAPANVTTGDVLALSISTGAAVPSPIEIDQPIYIAAGKGCYVISEGAETLAYRAALYTLL